MRLVRDHSEGAYSVNVPCSREDCLYRGQYGGSRMIALSEALIDPDGPSFAAYYHPACIPEGATISAGCNRTFCARCEPA